MTTSRRRAVDVPKDPAARARATFRENSRPRSVLNGQLCGKADFNAYPAEIERRKPGKLDELDVTLDG